MDLYWAILQPRNETGLMPKNVVDFSQVGDYQAGLQRVGRREVALLPSARLLHEAHMIMPTATQCHE